MLPPTDRGENPVIDLKLHANATTTPRTRAYIQKSQASNAALARELGIHSRTVARWKARHDVADRSTRPHRLATSMTEWEEALIVELRRSLALVARRYLEVMQRCLKPEMSRCALHRCLSATAISGKTLPAVKPGRLSHRAPAGFIHIDVKYLPPLDRRRSYAYVAIDRATRFVYLEILPDRRATTAAGFLKRFLDAFPLDVHTILTDNGVEFTDRFADDKKRKPNGQPSGEHPFDSSAPAPSAIASPVPSDRRPTASSSLASFPPQHGQALGAGITTRSRGRCAGKGARIGFLRVDGCTVVLPVGAAAISSSAALAAASSSCNSSWSSSLRPRSADCPYCSRRSLAICSL